MQRDLLSGAAGRPLTAAPRPAAGGPVAKGPTADAGPVPAELLESVLGLWRTELSAPGAGSDDDFFDLGGDSLRAADLVQALAEECGITLRLRDVFAHPTPRKLCVRMVGLGLPARPAEAAARSSTS